MASEEQAKSRKNRVEKFHKVREAMKFTQAQIAGKADVHINFYACVERGEENPSLE